MITEEISINIITEIPIDIGCFIEIDIIDKISIIDKDIIIIVIGNNLNYQEIV